MYRIMKSWTFAGCHHLIPPYSGQCSRVHGHTWKVEIGIRAEMLDSCGMVLDFTGLTLVRQYIESKFDHQNVNDTVEQPTCENIARHIFDYAIGTVPGVELVRVWESETSYGEYSR